MFHSAATKIKNPERTGRILRFSLIALLLFALLCSSTVWAEGSVALSLDAEILQVNVKAKVKLTPALSGIDPKAKPKYAWSSSDDQIASVKNGSVQGVAPGTAVITCTAELDGQIYTANAQVNVVQPVTSLKTTARNITLLHGESFIPEVTVLPENASSRAWTLESSNPAIVTVKDDAITAVGCGKCTVTVFSVSNEKAKASFSVYVPSMSGPEETNYKMDSWGDLEIPFQYYGSSFDQDVKAVVKGKSVQAEIVPGESGYVLRLNAETTGDSTITISDKKDAKAAIKLNVTVTRDAIPYYRQLLIREVKPTIESNLEVTLQNNTSQTIVKYKFRAIPYNKNGEHLYFSNAMGQEWVHWTFSTPIKPGEKRKFYCNLTSLKGAVDYDLAIEYLTYDAEETDDYNIPDSELYWFSSRTDDYLEKPAATGPYPHATVDQWKDYQSYSVGYAGSYMYPEMVEHYGYTYSGTYVTTTTPGTLAEKIGLLPGDNVYGVNGVLRKDNREIMAIGVSGFLHGEPLSFMIERKYPEKQFFVVTVQMQPDGNTEIINKEILPES